MKTKGEDEMIYLMIGNFFYEGAGLEPGFDEEGEIATFITKEPAKERFSGTIWMDKETGRLVGKTEDKFGRAELTGIKFEGEFLSFNKHYQGRKEDETVEYEFQETGRGENTIFYVGSYAGEKVNPGTARLILAKVDEGFFTPPTKDELPK